MVVRSNVGLISLLFLCQSGRYSEVFTFFFNTSKVQVLQNIHMFDTIWVCTRTMQELFILRQNYLSINMVIGCY